MVNLVLFYVTLLFEKRKLKMTLEEYSIDYTTIYMYELYFS